LLLAHRVGVSMPEILTDDLPVGIPASVLSQAETNAKPINLLAYVHLRNIYASTGAGRVARQLTEHLALRRDLNLQLLADPSDHARIVPLVGKPWSDFAYHFFRRETSKQQARWYLFNRPNANQFWPEAQIIFCTAESYVPSGHARLVVTLHDAAYFEQDAHRRDKAFSAQRLRWQLLYRKLASKADLFHTVSHFSAERLGHFFPSIASRIRVVHNAVTPHFFAPVTGEGLAYLRQAGLADQPFVLVPGGLHFRKNAELILAAWPLLQERFPDVTLAVVNHSDPYYSEKAAALGDHFRVLGFVSDAALRALYGAAQVVWFPSRYEGFGLPVVEAMACGAPVVASRASSLPEIAGDAALLVPANSAFNHAEAIESLLQSPSARNELADLGRLRAAGFTWGRSAATLKNYFAGLL
jgi:glycosyltransferase involved in cell wall biosynthesis